MDIIVAACVSQFHDSEDEFELLLAYGDGREIGHAMTRSAARQMASECADAIGDGAPDRRTVAGQQSGVSAIEAIEKYIAMRLAAHASECDDPTWPVPHDVQVMRDTKSAVLSIARRAEALQRENAEMKEALQNLMGCYDTPLSRRRFPPDDFMKEALNIARALLGGENAE